MTILLLAGSPSSPSRSTRLLHYTGEQLALLGHRTHQLQVRDLPATALSVCDFPGIDDLDGFKRALRETVDQTGRRLAAPRLVVEEALRGFRANIDVSAAVQAHCSTTLAASIQR